MEYVPPTAILNHVRAFNVMANVGPEPIELV
jgi:hypothetical protein